MHFTVTPDAWHTVLLKAAEISNYDRRGYTCKLADFGLSRVIETHSTHVSTHTHGMSALLGALALPKLYYSVSCLFGSCMAPLLSV